MLWGSGGHDPSPPNDPLPVSPSDVAIYAPLATVGYKTVTASYPSGASGKSVTFTGEIGLTEGVGETVSEEGLFTPTDILIARKTFTPFTKGSYIVRFEHTLIF